MKLKDIARETGVSISTVSRILSGDSSRKPSGETSRRVIEAATRMGYLMEFQARLGFLSGGAMPQAQEEVHEQGHPYAPESPQGNACSIGCILTSDEESFVSPFFSSLLAGIRNELGKSGGRLTYRFSVMNLKDPGFPHFIKSGNLDCAIMLGRTTLENINLLRESIPNLVYAGVNAIGSDFDEVLCDSHAGALHAVEYLAGLGHREIGFIGPTLRNNQLFNEHRYQGYVDGMKEAGLGIDASWVADTLLTSADGRESMLEMAARGRLPTAIFCGNDTVALGAMRALAELGVPVPGEISIIGFDDIETASYVKPSLTTIAVPTRELGRLAVKMLFDRLETGRGYAMRLSLPFRLVERESCRRLEEYRRI